MKQFLVAATLMVALTSAAFADGKNSNAKFLSDLKTGLKSVDQSAWQTTDLYKKAHFTVNKTNVNAYVNPETNALICFAVSIDASALPENAMENIAKKYPGWKVLNPTMFITASGQTSYYVQVINGKDNLALSISVKGKPSIYSKIPQ